MIRFSFFLPACSEALQSHLSIMMTSEEVLRLVKSSEPNGNLQLTYNCIAILSTLQMNGNVFTYAQMEHGQIHLK